MSGKFSELLHGDHQEVMYHLDSGECTVSELQLALTNAFVKIDSLQHQLNQLKGLYHSKEQP